jgi:hypothetical protein
MHEIIKQEKNRSYLTLSYSTYFSVSLLYVYYFRTEYIFYSITNILFNHFLKTNEKFKIKYHKISFFLNNKIS